MRTPVRFVGALGAVLALICTQPAPPARAEPRDPAAPGYSQVGAAPVQPRRGGARVPALRWTPCGEPFWCATAAVPLDWSHPRGRSISLALIKLPALDRRHRIGTVFVNPGGPGGSGVDFLRDAPDFLPADVRRRFDVVGFDPRFIGASRPAASCLDDEAFADFVNGLPAFPLTGAQERSFGAAQARYTRACAGRGQLRFASTASVARDLDLLRQAVGDRALTFVGYSYGTYLGQLYAQLFPGRVRALVLDGVVDANAWVRGPGLQWRTEPFSTRLNSAAASWRALREFFARCRAAGPQRCALAELGDPQREFTALADRLRQAPIDLGGGDRLDYPSLIGAATSVLYAPADWAAFAADLHDLVQALDAAPPAPSAQGRERSWDDRGVSPVPAARQIAGRLPAGGGPPRYAPRVEPVDPGAEAGNGDPGAEAVVPYDNGLAGFTAVACEDGLNPGRIGQWSRQAPRQDRLAPYFGRVWTWSSAACATWPFTDPNAYRGDFGRALPLLVVGTRFDPATPHAAAARAARRFPGSRLLTVDGYGHTSAALPSRCVDRAVAAYLLHRRLPAPGAVCRQDQVPFG